MTARKPLDHELSDAALDLQAQRWAEQAEARSRQKAILDARKKEWRNAPPQASGLKPFTDVWSDVEAQRRSAITEEQFWEQVIRSVHEGFFDSNLQLFYFVDEEIRITSKTLKEVVGMDVKDSDRFLVHAVVRSSWASIEALSEWAGHQRIETPIAWQAVLEKNPVLLPTVNPAILYPSPIGKAERTKQAIISCFAANPRKDAEKLHDYYLRISAILKTEKITAGARLVRETREKQARSGRNGNSVSA